MVSEKSYSALAFLVTVAIVAVGFWLGWKHRKEQGFWWGVAAILLIGFSWSLRQTPVKVSHITT